MSLFSKAEYQELNLPFKYGISANDLSAGLLSIEAYGEVLGEATYFFASYLVKREFYDHIESMANLLKDSTGKTLRVTVKIKNESVKKFKIDLNSLAQAYNDDRFSSMGLSAWTIKQESIIDRI